MIDLSAKYPVPTNKTWNVFDSSKMKMFKACPRKFFWRYVLGWEVDYPQINLIFGEAWHRALEAVYQIGYTKEAVEEGMQRFVSYYREFYSDRDDMDRVPKDPTTALEALTSYVTTYQGLDNFEVLSLEKSGSVLITDDVAMHYRMDMVIKNSNGQITGVDHKTTSWSSPNYANQWRMDFQMNLYTHALYSMYQPKDVFGMVINSTLFLKSRIEHTRYPIQKSVDMMNAWLNETYWWLSILKHNYEMLSEASVNDANMVAFPKNETNCIMFNKPCPYIDFCSAWANPLKRCDKVQSGFEISWWDPSDRDKGGE